MSRFKVGDLVTPISVKPYSDRIQRRLLGKTLVIYSFQDNGNSFLVFAGVIGDCGFFWHPDDLRLVSAVQPEPEADTAPEPEPSKKPDAINRELYVKQQSQKPLRRGDLVVSNGDIYVVIETNHADGGYWIHAMTGKGGQDYARAKELTRIGSIRKKVKRLKAQMDGGK